MKMQRPIINHSLKKLTFSEREIIKYINGIEKKTFKFSQKELAQATFTSEPTISRLIKKLNYKNYKDFYIKINSEMNNLNREYPVYKNDNVMNVAKNIINAHMYAVAEGIDSDVISTIQEVSKMITSLKGRLLIYGMGTSNKITQEFTTNLQRIGIFALTAIDHHTLLPLVALMNEQDVLILVSNSANNNEINWILKDAMRNQAKVVLITGNNNPPITPDVLINYKRLHYEKFKVPLSSKTIQNVICDLIFQITVNNSSKFQKNLDKVMKSIDNWRNAF